MMAGWRVREIAELQGYNPHKLALEAGLSYVTMRGIWFNTTTRADLATIETLCRVLKVRPSDIIDVTVTVETSRA